MPNKGTCLPEEHKRLASTCWGLEFFKITAPTKAGIMGPLRSSLKTFVGSRVRSGSDFDNPITKQNCRFSRGRFGSGRLGSGQVGSGRFGSGRVVSFLNHL